MLWNIFYDKVLRIDLVPAIKTVAYAEDLTIIVKTRNKGSLKKQS